MKPLWHGIWITSLLLALFIAGVWTACPWWTFALVHRSSGWMDAALICEDGHLYVLWAEIGTPSLIDPLIANGFSAANDGSLWDKPSVPSGNELIDLAGIHFVRPAIQGGLSWWVCPLAYPLILCLFAPFWQIWRWRRKRRIVEAGYCPRCGYDLRATPDACPECGYVPKARTAGVYHVT